MRGQRSEVIGSFRRELAEVSGRGNSVVQVRPFLLPLPHSPLPALPPLPTSIDFSARSSLRNRANAASPSPIQRHSILPGLGLRQLKRGLHAVLLALQQSLPCWSAIIEYCEADPDGHHKTACWPDDFDCALPIDAAADELTRLTARFAALAIPPASDRSSFGAIGFSRTIQRSGRPLRLQRASPLSHHRRPPPRSHGRLSAPNPQPPAPSPQSSPSATNTAGATFTRRCCSIIFPNIGSNPFTKATPKAVTSGDRPRRACASRSA